MKEKIMMMGLCWMALAANARAQFLDGIFSQSGTQRKEYEAQIAALKLFSSKVQQGYQIVEKGLSDIRDIRQGELGLHQAFFSYRLDTSLFYLCDKRCGAGIFMR